MVRDFKYWCYKVIPLVYDDSLSYYETLCKLVEYVNNIVDDEKLALEEIEALKKDMEEVQEWIENFDTTFVEQLVNDYLKKAVKNVIFGISTSGYFMCMIPYGWDSVEFGTIQDGELYGHLTLTYD